MLDKPWVHGLPPEQKMHYQPVTEFTYWTVLGSFNNCNIITFSYKATASEDFEDIHKVVLDGIRDNVDFLV